MLQHLNGEDKEQNRGSFNKLFRITYDLTHVLPVDDSKSFLGESSSQVTSMCFKLVTTMIVKEIITRIGIRRTLSHFLRWFLWIHR